MYRSSYKNARRLAATETNIAYRTADYLRWQDMDFVVGIEVKLSNNHNCKGFKPGTFSDICDELAGKYPKGFKFTGWHPHCRCHAEAILKTEEEFMADNERILNGEEPMEGSVNEVSDVPKGFEEWVDNNKERAKKSTSMPYFIRDNFKNGNLADGLKITYPVVPAQQEQSTTLSQASMGTKLQRPTQFEAKTPQEAIDFITANIADGCTLPIKKKDLPMVNQIINQVAERMKQFGLPKFKNVGVCARRRAEASWTEFNELNFNLSNMKPEKVMKAIQEWEKRGVKYSHYEGLDDVIRSTIDHELGHKLYGMYGMSASTTRAFGKAAVTRNGFNEIDDVLGYYATTDEQEYFAEAVARWMGKGRNGVIGYTKDLMEELMAKVEAKVGANPIAPTEDIHVLSETKLETAINKARKMLVRQDKEKMVVLNAKGVVIIEAKGTSSNVHFDEETAKKVANATITHNHPTGKGETGVMRLGYSLSSDDVYEAIRCNTRGIIAEAPYYRYSIERPNSGWRVDADVVRKRYREIYSEIKKCMMLL